MPFINTPTREPRVGYTLRPFVAGDTPVPNHTFEDFAIPRTYALVTPINEYEMQFARVYTPNPWYADEIRFFDWTWSKRDDTWYRVSGGSMNPEDARKDWKSRKAQGHTPRDVIANPFNESECPVWDIWTYHFSHTSYGFHALISTYENTYPRKVTNAKASS